MDKLAKLYLNEIVRLHGILSKIVTDRDSQFTLGFWQSIERAMSTELTFSTAFHPQTNGQNQKG